MIFLAVTMGFFAESMREHFVEVRNTRQYLETFKQELIDNKREFVRVDSLYKLTAPSQDSIIRIFLEKKGKSGPASHGPFIETREADNQSGDRLGSLALSVTMTDMYTMFF